MDPRPVANHLTRRTLLRDTGALLAASTLPVSPIMASAVTGASASASPAIMTRLSDYMGAAGDRALPEEVAEKTRQHVLDTVAAMVSGTTLAPGDVALQFASLTPTWDTDETPGEYAATIVGARRLSANVIAAITNGMLAHADETDDSHAPSHSHPGCAVVPAALAAGERFGISGARFLRAVALGYDIGTRVLMTLGSLEYQVRTHRDAHGLANTFGASAAAGCAASLSAQQMRWLLDYAAQQASGIAAWQRDTQHIEKAFVFGGAPARNGVTAALLIQLGATGVDDIFSGADNFLMAFAPDANPSGLIDKLGERYEITRTNIKKWTVGSPIQAPLDALQLIRQQHPFTVDQVQRVTVRLATTEAGTVNRREMPDISLQQMIAVMLVDGTVSFHAAHDRSRMQDPVLARERAKVDLVSDTALDPLYPQLVAIVDVALQDGRHWSQRVDDVRGTVRNPMTQAEVVAKSRDLMEPVLGDAQTSQLIHAILNLDGIGDVRTLRPLLQTTSSRRPG